MNSDITAILTGFRRPEYLREQYEAVANQTVKPKEIFFWQNHYQPHSGCGWLRNIGRGGHIGKFDEKIISKMKTARCNFNFNVSARFAFALNATTEYVCVFDDDTIPGKRWFENCLETIKTHRGLLGTKGLIFLTDSSYNPYSHEEYGWSKPNEKVVQVDIVGHSWFFEREFLSCFWREFPDLEVLFFDDMHFSYTLQKYLKLSTYVPPHPKDDKSLWGSLKGAEYGTDDKAMSCICNSAFIVQCAKHLSIYKEKGWKLLRF